MCPPKTAFFCRKEHFSAGKGIFCRKAHLSVGKGLFFCRKVNFSSGVPLVCGSLLRALRLMNGSLFLDEWLSFFFSAQSWGDKALNMESPLEICWKNFPGLGGCQEVLGLKGVFSSSGRENTQTKPPPQRIP